MSELKIKMSCDINLNGKIDVYINGKKTEFITNKFNTVELVEEEIKRIANESFITECSYENTYIQQRTNLNMDYKKDNLVADITHALQNDKTFMCDFRGVGKSVFLGRIAKQFNLPIVVKNIKPVAYADYDKAYRFSEDNLYGLDMDKTIIVDDLTLEDVEKMRNMGFKVAGFIRNVKFY